MNPIRVGLPKEIQSIQWKRTHDESRTDVTNAVREATISATPHPDESIAEPKGYTVTLTLDPDNTAFAQALEEALLDVQAPEVTVEFAGVDAPVNDIPVSVTKVPYLPDQCVAELSVTPEGQERLHSHFSK